MEAYMTSGAQKVLNKLDSMGKTNMVALQATCVLHHLFIGCVHTII